MPVRKFRSAEEMNQPIWHSPGDPALYQAIAAVWEMGRRTNPRLFPPGVHRYRSIEEMSRARDESEAEYVAALRTLRDAAGT
jgi:hypothetical protein